MKLGDKIREWCNDAYSGRKIRTTKDLYVIADLIDSDMLILPKTADDVSIHVGDTAYLEDGREVKIIRFIFEHETPTIICSLDDNPDVVHLSFELWHERPDSLKRIADDIETFGNEADINDTAVKFLCKIQERIRDLAAKSER